jgi:AGCS family alanine or glycine:cation symporter
VVICTASAVIIMLAPRGGGEDAANGIQAIQYAMNGLVGGWGASFVAVIVLLFAFSSIVANYIYAENNLIFLRFNSPTCIWALRIITILMVLTGTMMSLPVVWRLADIIMALLLSPTVRILASDYLHQRRLGVQPTFDAARYPEIRQQLAPGTWDGPPRE